jgi:acetyl-CoA acetyltransferase
MPTRGQRDIVFLSGKRTGFGGFGGSLKDFTATDLGAFSSVAAIEAAGIGAEAIDAAFFGNALQTSADALYLARHIALRCGVPEDRPALTVNRLCGSGFEAVVQSAKEILVGDARVCLAGGTESMSQAPHAVRGARWGGLRLGPPGGCGRSIRQRYVDAAMLQAPSRRNQCSRTDKQNESDQRHRHLFVKRIMLAMLSAASG